MHINMEKVAYEDLSEAKRGMTTAEMRAQVSGALEFAKRNGRVGFNSDMKAHDLEMYCSLGHKEKIFMNRAYDAFAMSPRAYSRTLKVARTIADLAESTLIRTEHLAEALNYRLQE